MLKVVGTRARRLATGKTSPADAVELGELLRDHVRFEERELFPMIEAGLHADRLDALGTAIEEAGASEDRGDALRKGDRDG